MKTALKLVNEDQRLRKLYSYNLLDTPEDRCLNDFVQIASMICNTPIALISLVDENRQWFKAKVGLEASETSRDLAFCSHAILQDEVFVVEDALSDERFFDNPLVVGEPRVRFYAGAPLKAPGGLNIGTLCVIDHEKRQLTSEQLSSLEALSRQIMTHLALVLANKKQYELETELRQSKFETDRINRRLELAEIFGRFGSWDLDLESGQVNYSKGYFNILGIETKDKVVLEDIISVIHPEDREIISELSDRLLNGKIETFEVFYRVLERDGTFKYVRSTGELVNKKIFGTLLDVTEMKNMEKSLVAEREIALSASRAKSRFLANMSHEIRTPLNGIIGLSKLLSEDLSSSPEKQQLSTIIGCAETLLEIITDILDFSKLEAGTVELSKEDFEVNQLISTVVESLSYRAVGGKVKLNWTPQKELFVQGDPLRLKQVIMNLLSNALKFTEKGEINVRLLVQSLSEDRVLFQLVVEDTGVGINEDGIKKLFRPFSQVDNSSSRRFGGTGLGLAITKDLVIRMGGDIHVCSVPGSGSKFTVSLNLPARWSAEVKQMKVVDYACHPFPLNILIAEDVETNILVVEGFLSKLGYTAKVVRNGQEVLEEISKKNYDLILMDCHMPLMDGFEATKIIRENEHHNDIQIIALSAGTTEEEKLMSLKVGMDGFLSKPLRLQGLADCLQSVYLDSRKKISGE